MSFPNLPLQALPGQGRAPDTLSTFSNGRTVADVMLEPLPSFNRSLSITLPWNARVTDASVNVQAVGRSITRTASESAADLSAGTVRNLTLESDGLQLSRGSWGWNQSGAALGQNCSVSGGAFDGGLRIGNSNPPLLASGGGVWLHRMPLTVTEPGGQARTNETVNVRLSFPAGEVVNPYKEVRLTDSAGAEQPVFVSNAAYSGHHCTGADAVFVVPSIAASATDTYYVYYGNPAANVPSYAQQVFLADGFSGPALAPSWTATSLDGLSYSAGGALRVYGTASSQFWQGTSLENSHELPAGFELQATVDFTSASGTGYFALLSVFQDSQNAINLGIQYDSGFGSLSPAKFILGRTVSGTTTIDFASDAGGTGTAHTISGVYSSGSFSGYVDGDLLGTVSLQLSSQRLRLSAAARASGDSIDVSFDGLLAYKGYSLLGADDPALAVMPGTEEQVGYAASATLTSPLIQNIGLLPFGTARLESRLPPGTDCTLSVLGPSNETLASGLANGQSVPLDPAEHPAVRLRADLTTSDPGATPLLASWGIGDQWSAGLDVAGEYLNLQNVTLSSDGIGLSRSPGLWNRSASAALREGIASTFDSAGVSHPWVLRSEGLYRMYYAGSDGTRWRIGLATSPDGEKWTRYPDSPVLVTGSGWESSQLDWPCVIYNGVGYEMWYAGSSDGGATFRIGYATSPDGITWNRCPSNPVVSNGSPGDWDSASVFAPRVLFDGSNYTMWFAGKNATVAGVGEASSADGIAWSLSASNPVLMPPADGWSSLGVVPGGIEPVPGQGYLMWYGGYNATLMGVGLAQSPDGSMWTVRNPDPVIVNGDPASMDSAGATFPSVLFNGNSAMYFSAFDGAKWRIGRAQACFCPEGGLLSPPVDLGTAPASIRLAGPSSAPENTGVSVQARSSQDGASWSSWISLGASPVNVPPGRFIQWTASLQSADNDSTPVVQRAAADLVYRWGLGEAELPPVALQPSQNLTRATCSATFSGAKVSVLASTDNGTTWQSVPPGVPLNLSGTSLRMKVVLAGNFTESPKLADISYSYTFNSYPSGCALDVGADGEAEWSVAGVFTGAAAVSGLAEPLNAYLDSHRNDTGDIRQIPLSLWSATSCLVNVSGLRVEWSAMVFTDNPPHIESSPPGRAMVNELYIYDIDARDPDRRDRLAYSLDASPEGMTISYNTGEITWTPNVKQVGYHAVKLTVSDGQLNVSQEFTLVVSTSPVNNPPALTGVPPDRATVGYECSSQFNATDPDADRVRFYLAAGAAAGATVNESTGLFSWIPAMNQAGLRIFELRVTDGIDAAQLRFIVNVSSAGANGLPTVTSVPPPTARVNLPYCYSMTATDADNDTLSFYILAGPAGAAVSADGTFSWTPSGADVGTVAVSIKVSDGKGYSVYNFTIRVHLENMAPVFENLPLSLKPSAGNEWVFSPVASDPDKDPVVFSLATGPAGMTVDPATGVMRWTPSTSQKGTFHISLAASDGIATAFLNFTLTIGSKAASKGFLEQYGLMLAFLVAIIAAGAATAAVLGRRRRVQSERAIPGLTLSKPRIIEPAESAVIEEGGERGTAEPASTLPPPEPQAAVVAEPMKPVGTISREQLAAVPPTIPPQEAAPGPSQLPIFPAPPIATPPPPAPLPPPPAEEMAPPVAAGAPPPPVPAPPARKAPEIIRPSRQPPPPAPAPQAAAPGLMPAPGAVQEPSRQTELYKPIPGPYEEKHLDLGAAPLSFEAPRPPPPPPGPPSAEAAGELSLASTASSLDRLLAQMETDAKAAGTPQAREHGTGGATAVMSEDMDFLRSFLADKDKASEKKAVERSSERGELEQFTREWETDNKPGEAPAPHAPPPSPPPLTPRQPQPAAPATAPEKKEEPKKEEPTTTLSLDDILNELES